MITTPIISIVEGHGEVEALPVLIRRVFTERVGQMPPPVNPPIRIKSGSFLKDASYFEKYIALAAAKAAQADGRVLILLDCEDDCPATLGPDLLERARALRADIPFVVVLAYREYETWFLAAADSLAGKFLNEGTQAPSFPEGIRGAKEWLTRNRKSPYDPIAHQAAFSAHFDFEAALAIPSFSRFMTKLLA